MNERMTAAEYRALNETKPKAHGVKRGANGGASGTCVVCGKHVYARNDLENQAWFHTDDETGESWVKHIACL